MVTIIVLLGTVHVIAMHGNNVVQLLVWQCSYSNGYHGDLIVDIQLLCCYGNSYHGNVAW